MAAVVTAPRHTLTPMPPRSRTASIGDEAARETVPIGDKQQHEAVVAQAEEHC